ncbi:MAG: DUF4157 domain-containing protein [Pyrinomonadaceae bacterium]
MGDTALERIASTAQNADGKLLPKAEVDVIKQLPGTPLPEVIIQELERTTGVDLKNVRVHAGETALRITKAINATAFTFDNKLFISPEVAHGDQFQAQELMREELKHMAARQVNRRIGLETKRISSFVEEASKNI